MTDHQIKGRTFHWDGSKSHSFSIGLWPVLESKGQLCNVKLPLLTAGWQRILHAAEGSSVPWRICIASASKESQWPWWHRKGHQVTSETQKWAVKGWTESQRLCLALVAESVLSLQKSRCEKLPAETVSSERCHVRDPDHTCQRNLLPHAWLPSPQVIWWIVSTMDADLS